MPTNNNLTDSPVVIAVAPNGARKGKDDHAELPISPAELADCAAACLEQGATMIHLHVRDDNGIHSLAPEHYRPAITAVRNAVGDQMLIQVTTEAAGHYVAADQITNMLELAPDFVSIALREFVSDGQSIANFKRFIHNLSSQKCLIQYILYDFEDHQLYLRLREQDVITENHHSLLMVLGRYTQSPATIEIVDEYHDLLTTNPGFMVCTFGPSGQQILQQSAQIGCHIRVGFENGFLLPNGEVAKNNEHLVAETIKSITCSGRALANITQTRNALGFTDKY